MLCPGYGQQYKQISVPYLAPSSLVTGAKPPLLIVPGDFVKTYQPGGPGFRRFDALVTCFFIDTPKDVEEVFRATWCMGSGRCWKSVTPRVLEFQD